MPTVRKQVVAICCADIHLSLKPPVARAGEEDWLAAQGRVLQKLCELQKKHDVPILCAGDVFDRWNSPPELINWSFTVFPHMFTIPGQHDLPFHNIDLLHKSAYWTLSKACIPSTEDKKWRGRENGISHLKVGNTYHTGNLTFQGFPWGVPLTPPRQKFKNLLYVALIHQYVWIDGKEYPGAPKEAKLGDNRLWQEQMKGWDVIIFGDNHKGFLTKVGGTTVFNCGGLQRRKSDEIGYRPQVGLLYNDGSIEPHLLDCSADIIEDTGGRKSEKEDMDLKDFLNELSHLQSSQLDFEEAVKQILEERNPRTAVRQLILEALE